jgi:hypothetical protein
MSGALVPLHKGYDSFVGCVLVKRLKELETENARLRKAVSDLTLEKVILKEAASGNW